MRQYNVTGMSCAACSARVEKQWQSSGSYLLLRQPSDQFDGRGRRCTAGADHCGGGTGRVRCLRKRSRRKETVRSRCNCTGRQRDTGFKTQTDRICRIFTGIDVFFHGTYDVGVAAAAWFEDNHIAMGLVQLLLAGIVMVINQKFFISGFKSLWHRSPNMDTLVAMGSMVSFLWSVYVLFAMTRAQVDGNVEAVMDI